MCLDITPNRSVRSLLFFKYWAIVIFMQSRNIIYIYIISALALLYIYIQLINNENILDDWASQTRKYHRNETVMLYLIIMYPLAFVAGSLQGHWWGFISRKYVVWPIFFLMNVFIALKGTHFWILFTFTAAGVVPCGGRKTSPRTSTIVQFIFYFWSFEISVNILRNQK